MSRIGKLAIKLADKTKADHGAKCCSNQTTDTFVQPVIQERAWTSPIWSGPPARP